MAGVSKAAQIIHATTICVDGHALVILGASGSGKSALALELIALGATLVADDRTELSIGPQGLTANCPPAIQGLIEARGVGLLQVPYVQDIPVLLAVDLDQDEQDRLPSRHNVVLLGQSLRCLHKCYGTPFAAALYLSLKYMTPTQYE